MKLKVPTLVLTCAALSLMAGAAFAQTATPPADNSAASPVADPTAPAPTGTDAGAAGATGTAAELPSAVAADPSVPTTTPAQTDPASSGAAADLSNAAAADPSLPENADVPTAVSPEKNAKAFSEAECSAPSAEIVRLREPQFGADNMWDILFRDEAAAEAGMEVFSDLVQIGTDEFVAAGSYTKDKDDPIYHPLLVKYDERMKPVWTTRDASAEQRTITRILKTKGGFTVLGDLSDKTRGNGIYIASYGDDGKLKGKPAPFYERGGDLDAKAIIPAQDGGGYIVAAQFIDARDQEKQHGLLYKISSAGKVVWKRSYQPGESTVFNNVQATLDGTYVISGQIILGGNKGGGWLIRVDRSGAIIWQRTYPRGQSASLQSAAQTKEGNFILSGKVRPLGNDGTGLSAWVVKTDSAGSPIWQRYFQGTYDYEAPDLIVYEDGRASVLLTGGGMDADHRSHIRLITFSPQGLMQHVEDFTDGQNASAHRLISGANGERIAVGYAQTSFGDSQEGNEASAAPSYTFDGWAVAAPPLDSYEDPCGTVQPKMSPILR